MPLFLLYCRISSITFGLNAKSAIKFGIDINPLMISAISQTASACNTDAKTTVAI